MVKAIEVIVVLTLLVFSFFAGVKYSDSIKNHASWLFEAKEEEVELPDLSNENGAEIDATIGENGENLDNGNMMMEAAPEAAPTEAAAPTPTPATQH
jgi:hypothetical protein